ncbi:lysophospholipid acyltransferase family protein [Lichenihabitans psoromatis]|uniref:lysophospholipid acyltransferase family protein n=1 Tax=Lichenihabitans psoromatis TaxID=2528642 RepID=UPI0010363196|nr:lysophospholipid acyltransferase family protein [Lichenihabitans psoromatis]
MERIVAGVFRLALLVVVLVNAVAILAPLQLLAQRFGWPIARRIPVLFCRSLCWIVNLRPHFVGSPASGPRLLVPNHVSWLDIPAMGCYEPVCFIAKREVGTWPILGRLAKSQGAIFIDRTRRRGIPASNRSIALALLERRSVILFAEGTTGDGNRIMRFMTSHFEAAKVALQLDASLDDIAVQPVSIAYTRSSGMPLGRHGRHRIAWYGDMTLLPHLWGMVTGGPIDCDIQFDRAIAVSRSSDRKRVGAQAERAVRTITGLALLGRPARRAETAAASAGTTDATGLPQAVLIGVETA